MDCLLLSLYLFDIDKENLIYIYIYIYGIKHNNLQNSSKIKTLGSYAKSVQFVYFQSPNFTGNMD